MTMTRTTTKTIEFFEVTISEEEVKQLLIDFAQRDCSASHTVDLNGIAVVRSDNYRGYIVTLQKKED